MDFDVLDSLEDLRSKALDKDSDWKTLLEIGPQSPAFTQLVESLSKELQNLRGMDSCINAITDPDDSSSFLLEVSTFMKELQCPYKALVTGPINQRLLDEKSRLVLLDYLCTELQAARLLHIQTKKELSPVKMDNVAASQIKAMRNVLTSEPAINENPIVLLSEIEEKIQEHLSVKPELIPKPALEEEFPEESWNYLETLHQDFQKEYSVRREMLLTRLDVTIQSFNWGESSKGKSDQIYHSYAEKRNMLKKTPSVELSDLIAARENLLFIEKTSSADLVKNTKSKLNRILIPAVPDRGGRPGEQRPAKEMPSWTKRSSGREGGGGGRGDYRGRGNRQQRQFKSPKEKNKDKGNFDAAGSY